MRAKLIQLGLVGVAILLGTASASATLVSADFNDLAAGDVNGQAGGTGLAATWTAPVQVDVIAGDLSAPSSTNFALTQSGTAQSLQGTGDSSAGKASRNLTTALTDTVWFSFLLTPTTSGRGGIDLDGSRILAVGTQFRVFLNNVVHGTTSPFTVGQTALVLGKVEIDADVSGNDWFTAWVNPDVENLGTATLTVTDKNWITDASIGQLGVETYQGDTTAASIVDLITLSNGSNAYGDVTGVIPEPASLVLLLCAVASWFVWRRRR